MVGRTVSWSVVERRRAAIAVMCRAISLRQVASTTSSIALNQLWISWGAGIRFLLVPEERISLRFDVGVARGVPQFYLGFNEAF